MHTCDPPIDALNAWLTQDFNETGRYGHLLLEQTGESDQALLDALRPYFESAHLDARNSFHEFIGIDLHPDVNGDVSHVQYPSCLPLTARRGIFGELMAGLVAESYPLVGGHTWVVPIYLFRYHEDVKAYMFALVRDPTRTRQVWGRFGNDFIGICLDQNGEVVRLISGEAKWRQSLTQSMVDNLLLGNFIDDPENPGQRIRSGKGVWHEVNRESHVPHGLRQLQLLLEEYDPEGYSTAILSMDRALSMRDPQPIDRTDLILFVGNSPPTRPQQSTWVPRDVAPIEYTAGNDLQVVEIYLSEGEEVIDTLYNSLWLEEQADGAE